ncbi:Hypothetical protein D9617_2g055190 [Elsinoe fawcettii]|nr:Hypothetical protein D9617_2g055190 [Elsinoe fawcettii]
MDDNEISIRMGILSLLTKTPEASTEAQYPERVPSSTHGCLSIEREATIAQYFAFISSWSPDPTHVMAVAMEILPSPPSIRLLVAANTAKHLAMRARLTQICHILSAEANDVSRNENDKALLEKIIGLHQRRILERMRVATSRAQKAKGKPALIAQLQTARKLLSNSEYVGADALSDMKHMLDGIEAYVKRLEQQPLAETLTPQFTPQFIRLIESLGEFTDRYAKDLVHVPYVSGTWETDTTVAVQARLQKLNKYNKVHAELLRASRRYECFKAISVHFVDGQLQKPRVTSEDEISKLMKRKYVRTVIERISTIRAEPVLKMRSELEAFQRERTRVHAEMQIMLHCDRGEAVSKPRCIISGKSACYMCHLVLKLHPAYHTPSSHGKLYEKWCIPPWITTRASSKHSDRSGEMHRRLRNKVTVALDEKIYAILQCNAMPMVLHPAESLVDFGEALTPSITSNASILLAGKGVVTARTTSERVVSTKEADSGSIGPHAATSDSIPQLDHQPEHQNTKMRVRTGQLELFIEYKTLSRDCPATVQSPHGQYHKFTLDRITADEDEACFRIDMNDSNWLQTTCASEHIMGKGMAIILNSDRYLLRCISNAQLEA